MIYCDTSLLVAALTNEAATADVQHWLGAQEAGSLCVGGWVGAELSSALAIKLRHRELTLDQRAEVLAQWRRLLGENLVMLPVPAQAWDLAARFVDRHEPQAARRGCAAYRHRVPGRSCLCHPG